MKIGMLGGTFNPPHIGHLHAAQAAQRELGLDDVLFVPTNQPPHKTVPENSATTEQRLEMARLAAGSIGAHVSTVELDRGGKSYTADTLTELKKLYADAEIWLIMGTDMFLTLQNWYAPQRIFDTAHIAVVAREASSQDILIKQRERLMREYNARVDLINTHAIEVSSTQLRENEAVKDEFLPPEVREYINKHKLYQKVGELC